MNIFEISLDQFKNFSKNHQLGNFHQSIDYAMLKAEEGFEYEFIGYGDSESIIGVALILYKKIGNIYYGYSPRGFLVDYSNQYMLRDFTDKLIGFYKKRNFAFIKINPEIAVAKLNKQTKIYEYNGNKPILNNLTSCGYKKLKDNMNFESLLPRVNAIVNLENFNQSCLKKNTKNKVKKAIRKGLYLELAKKEDLDILHEFIKNKQNKDEYYYKDLYNIFSKHDAVDLFLVKIDYKQFLINAQYKYNKELAINSKLNDLLLSKSNPNIINTKMNSDRALLSYKDDVAEASKNINSSEDTPIAGALVIKSGNRITIQISGFDKRYSRFAPNYFLYNAILNYYKGKYKYADLNGVTADLSKDNYYYGLNRFKLGFNPDIYEYVGEYDLVINEMAYDILLKSGYLAKEFNK